VSDSGGPEDPEVVKLRQQLAAAERAADLRAQLEAVNAEIDQFDSDIAKLESFSSSDTSATDARSAGADGNAKSAENVFSSSDGQDGDTSYRKRRFVLALLVIIVGLAVAIPGFLDRSSRGIKPSLTLKCPTTWVSDSSGTYIEASATWVVSKKAGIDEFSIFYSPLESGKYSLKGGVNNSEIHNLLRRGHDYGTWVRGTIGVGASLTDGFGRVAESKCSFYVPLNRMNRDFFGDG
jgi:hypothetical protein